METLITRAENRIAELDRTVAKEMEAAEQRAADDTETRRKIVQFIVGTLALSAAIVGAAAVGAGAAQQAYVPSHNYGNYRIIRSGNSATVYTPTGQIYTCHSAGNVTSCF